ncbi:MAG: nucleotidyltransferase domain-containing protein [Spirochaetales bacterium]|nr:nucleotidyltransferase domain-containing protein [Spirochaetales bacterium]
MYQHHRNSIDNVIEKMKKNDNVLALIIAGSIAHGFANEDADIDIMIVVSREEYEKRCKDNEVLYWERESCTYEKGYVDGKYISTEFIREVIRHGGEPARFAFKDAYIAYSRIPDLENMIDEASRYPKQYKDARMRRLYARFLEWRWFYDEGKNKNNVYLFNTSLCNIVLYGGRSILAYNELLYPYHKWFLRVLEGAAEKPPNLIPSIEAVLETKSHESVERYVAAIKEFTDWGISDTEWPRCVMSGENLGCHESEL